jgi:hypothetical protein
MTFRLIKSTDVRKATLTPLPELILEIRYNEGIFELLNSSGSNKGIQTAASRNNKRKKMRLI